MTYIAGIQRRESDAHEVIVRMLERSLPGVPSSEILQRTLSVNPNLSVSSLLTRSDLGDPGSKPPLNLPEDAFDLQPLQNDQFVLVGDIRIDNREEIISLLGLSLAGGLQMADSEIFLRAWSTWEKAALERVIGGFAVAIWDRRERELCLVRDHPGERPLYYSHTPTNFAFASMPRTLRAIPGVDTSLDEEHMLHFLAIVPDAPDLTFFKNIQLLPPAHYLTFRDGILVRKQYWHPMDAPAVRLGSNREYQEALLEIFDRAVKARLRTGGSIGAQLSGGMDSSSVTATAAGLLGNSRLTAFTAVPQPAFSNENPVGRFGDEGPAAGRLAAMYQNIDHVLIDPAASDLIRVIEETGKFTDTPVFNPTNQLWINTILNQAKSRGISVLLQGVCGNATISFGGLIGLADMVKSGEWLSVWRQVRELRRNGHASWRGAGYLALAPVLPLALRRFIGPQASSFSFDFSPLRPALTQQHHFRERAFQEFFASDESSAASRRKMFDYYDAGFANGGASLGWGISLRDPTQDKRIFDFCFAIPIEQYLAEGQTRSLVRRSMRGRVPPETLACTTRGLQAADWFLTLGARRAEMAAELKKIAQSPTAQKLLDVERLQRLLDTWPTSGYERPEVYDSWHLALGRGLAAGNFMRHNEGS